MDLQCNTLKMIVYSSYRQIPTSSVAIFSEWIAAMRLVKGDSVWLAAPLRGHRAWLVVRVCFIVFDAFGV